MTTLMIQGTASDVGKSVIVAGICRVLANRSFNVAPMKPQNMALNSAVTDEGLEIGRAQWVQAMAARQKPHVDFNPILLKPESDTGAQVIIHGKALTTMQAQQYHAHKPHAMAAVLESHKRLALAFDHIVVEGAGSPAEINLREGDIANMGFAEAVDCPVILVADIDKGGVFAQLVGTLELLSKSEQNRVVGFVINKFRGDIGLLESGLDWLENRTGKPVLGVLPYCHELHLAAEDAIESEQRRNEASRVKICVLGLPRISNHTDFDPLRLHTDIDLEFVMPQQNIPACDLVIIPGSKSVAHDLEFLRKQGWDVHIQRHLRYGGKVFGICGGYQMLGQSITDPCLIESQVERVEGLQYLNIYTQMNTKKTLRRVSGEMTLGQHSCAVTGYEIHCGQTQLNSASQASVLNLTSGHQQWQCGAQTEDQQIAGCYLHGLFDEAPAVTLLLSWLGHDTEQQDSIESIQENAIETLANTLEHHLDIPKLFKILNEDKHHE
ncbi:cobyric acid synthase [Echinimonas agarilytica]|uniref:Cobyric acid synthase n=1 Tax=Echinimonas agarilytica TaxID=1215918 RepID=A0AA42B8K8_9GAMM|nr:cobyric acid synthase [Echinimonas agarilytica]MCM2681145.1 cobyric acid synthase [Echinimonas agarilytica]